MYAIPSLPGSRDHHEHKRRKTLVRARQDLRFRRVPKSNYTVVDCLLLSFRPYPPPKPSHATSAKLIRAGSPSRMVGRAANIITGVCHGLSLDVNREARCDTTTLLSVSPQEKPPTPNQLSWGNPKVPHSTPDSFPFTVVDVAGFLYGFFGVHSGPRGSGPTYIGAGLVTSMDEVLASIKGKIGVDLMLP